MSISGLVGIFDSGKRYTRLMRVKVKVIFLTGRGTYIKGTEGQEDKTTDKIRSSQETTEEETPSQHQGLV